MIQRLRFRNGLRHQLQRLTGAPRTRHLPKGSPRNNGTGDLDLLVAEIRRLADEGLDPRTEFILRDLPRADVPGDLNLMVEEIVKLEDLVALAQTTVNLLQQDRTRLLAQVAELKTQLAALRRAQREKTQAQGRGAQETTPRADQGGTR